MIQQSTPIAPSLQYLDLAVNRFSTPIARNLSAVKLSGVQPSAANGHPELENATPALAQALSSAHAKNLAADHAVAGSTAVSETDNPMIGVWFLHQHRVLQHLCKALESTNTVPPLKEIRALSDRTATRMGYAGERFVHPVEERNMFKTAKVLVAKVGHVTQNAAHANCQIAQNAFPKVMDAALQLLELGEAGLSTEKGMALKSQLVVGLHGLSRHAEQTYFAQSHKAYELFRTINNHSLPVILNETIALLREITEIQHDGVSYPMPLYAAEKAAQDPARDADPAAMPSADGVPAGGSNGAQGGGGNLQPSHFHFHIGNSFNTTNSNNTTHPQAAFPSSETRASPQTVEQRDASTQNVGQHDAGTQMQASTGVQAEGNDASSSTQTAAVNAAKVEPTAAALITTTARASWQNRAAEQVAQPISALHQAFVARGFGDVVDGVYVPRDWAPAPAAPAESSFTASAHASTQPLASSSASGAPGEQTASALPSSYRASMEMEVGRIETNENGVSRSVANSDPRAAKLSDAMRPRLNGGAPVQAAVSVPKDNLDGDNSSLLPPLPSVNDDKRRVASSVGGQPLMFTSTAQFLVKQPTRGPVSESDADKWEEAELDLGAPRVATIIRRRLVPGVDSLVDERDFVSSAPASSAALTTSNASATEAAPVATASGRFGVRLKPVASRVRSEPPGDGDKELRDLELAFQAMGLGKFEDGRYAATAYSDNSVKELFKQGGSLLSDAKKKLNDKDVFGSWPSARKKTPDPQEGT